MKGIFISYRRDDTAGHAGRLFDGLQARFGAGHVFMDVSALRPGQDFVVELERALAAADHLLVVIGPRWAEAADSAGRRRLDDPEDFVRREIAAGLAKGATVIPVLVHGAEMPAAQALPEALRALARRQAIELTDQRWESDLRELCDVLAAGGGRAAPAVPMPQAAAGPPAGGRQLAVGAAVVLGVVVASVALWLGLRPPETRSAGAAPEPAGAAGRQPAPTAVEALRKAAQPAVEGIRKAQPGAGAASRPAAAPPRYAIAIPEVSEVRFRTSRAQVVFTILGIRQEPRDADTQLLTFVVRMLNRGPLDESFGSDGFRLVAGEQAIAPLDFLNSLTDGMSAKEARLRFVVPARLGEAALEVRMNAESTRIPISLAARTPITSDPTLDDFGRPRRARVVDTIKPLPATLPAGQRVQVGQMEFQIVEATIERETVEKASLTLTVRGSLPRGNVATNFWSDSVRLWIDGVPRAPVNSVNLVVEPGDSREARFVYDFNVVPQSLEVGLNHAGDRVRVPLSLASVLKR